LKVGATKVPSFVCFYSLLSFLYIWAISGDVPFVFSMKEIVLPSWLVVGSVIFVPWFILVVSLIVLLAQRLTILVGLRKLLSLLLS
jgi:hypothetical protein